MTDSWAAPRTAAALRARRERAEAAMARIGEVLDRMLKTRTTITFAAVAKQAGVSRTFLYEHAEARAAVGSAMNRAEGGRIQARQDEHDALEAAWKERALNAEDALKAAHNEILMQREQIGDLLGQVRDLQTQWTEEDLIRVVNDNSNMKKQVRRLNDENTKPQNKLTAARDNVRFADRRIAALEAESAEAALS